MVTIFADGQEVSHTQEYPSAHENFTPWLRNIAPLKKKERALLTTILQHLREVERRKLFCDFGYGSLFEYAVKELKYSKEQAERRIQAMHLLKEFPKLNKRLNPAVWA